MQKWINMRYVSCFTGIGGLEGSIEPYAVCEIDSQCQRILGRKFPQSELIPDISEVSGFESDVIVGGWPCQDLSVAGRMDGLQGVNSKQFYSLLKASERVKAHTLIAENVPNLLVLNKGNVFREVLAQLREYGYRYCSWRTLNARQFGLPHQRNRVFLIASAYENLCLSIFRDIIPSTNPDRRYDASGFYWTAGSQSICYSEGYVPTIKVGSSLSIASPPAVHYRDVVRMITPSESLKLQGFPNEHFSDISPSDIYRMTGNAVAVPVGQFVVDGVLDAGDYAKPDLVPKQAHLDIETEGSNISPFMVRVPHSGLFDGDIREVKIRTSSNLARNLAEFLDTDLESTLTRKQASGLLRRLARSGVKCPENLLIDLNHITT